MNFDENFKRLRVTSFARTVPTETKRGRQVGRLTLTQTCRYFTLDTYAGTQTLNQLIDARAPGDFTDRPLFTQCPTRWDYPSHC